MSFNRERERRERERERASERERERERERASERERESHFGSSAAPFVWGLALPSFIGGGGAGGLDCSSRRAFPVSLSGA